MTLVLAAAICSIASVSAEGVARRADDAAPPQRPRVALLLAGHYRRHDVCAKSVREHVLEEASNEQFNFHVVAITYSDRFGKLIHGAGRDANADLDSPVTEKAIKTVYRKWPVTALILDAEKHKASTDHFDKRKAAQRWRHIRLSSMLKLLALGYRLVLKADGSGEATAFVLKLRFDLRILAPFAIRIPESGLRIIVPATMQSGPSRLRGLSTHACSADGSLRPIWVQDHVAYGSLTSMAKYTMTTSLYFDRKPGSSAEGVLARTLQKESVRVHCDKAIKYTIVR